MIEKSRRVERGRKEGRKRERKKGWTKEYKRNEGGKKVVIKKQNKLGINERR